MITHANQKKTNPFIMKKNFVYQGFIFLCLIFINLIISASCNKDLKHKDNENNAVTLPIKVTAEDVSTETKTSLEGVVTSWVAFTDKIGILSNDARTTPGGETRIENAQFTAQSSGTSTSFSGTMYWRAGNTSHIFAAYYPYKSFDVVDLNNIPMTLPAVQIQSQANNTAHLSDLDILLAKPVDVISPSDFGSTVTVNFKFYHIFPILEFRIKGSGQLKAIKLISEATLHAFSGDIWLSDCSQDYYTSYAIKSLTDNYSRQVIVSLTTPATLTTTSHETTVYMVIASWPPKTETYIIGLSSDGENWTYTTKEAPPDGFKKGKKYIVELDKSVFTTSLPVDIDNNVYNTVIIGSQEWMRSNLNTTKYNDGTNIPNITDHETWSFTSTGAYCNIDNNVNHSIIPGRLYNWYAVNTGKLCPTGWRVPSDADWTALSTFLTDNGYGDGGSGDDIARSMAAKHSWPQVTTHLYTDIANNNSSGFSGIAGKYRTLGFTDVAFEGGSSSYWWSSTDYYGDDSAWFRAIGNNPGLLRDYALKQNGYFVRCVRDIL